MNRVIKFRVWNQSTKNWVAGHGPNKISSLDGINLFGETILLGEFMNGVSIEELNDCVALQFTGAKDCDGKEIFEGDVVKLPDDKIGKVIYSDNLTGFLIFVDRIHYNGSYPLVMEQDGVNKNKVVGNIFENPELLEN